MIALVNSLEGQLWQIIVDAYGYDEDTHLGRGKLQSVEGNGEVIACQNLIIGEL